MTNETVYSFPMSCEGQMSLLDPDDTPPHGMPRPAELPPIPPDEYLRMFSTEEIVSICLDLGARPLRTDDEHDLFYAALRELGGRNVTPMIPRGDES